MIHGSWGNSCVKWKSNLQTVWSEPRNPLSQSSCIESSPNGSRDHANGSVAGTVNECDARPWKPELRAEREALSRFTSCVTRASPRLNGSPPSRRTRPSATPSAIVSCNSPASGNSVARSRRERVRERNSRAGEPFRSASEAWRRRRGFSPSRGRRVVQAVGRCAERCRHPVERPVPLSPPRVRCWRSVESERSPQSEEHLVATTP